MLLKAGADLEHVNKNGDTALTLAAANESNISAKLLIDAKANIEHANGAGKTALVLAHEKNNTNLIEMIEQRRANKDTSNTKASYVEQVRGEVVKNRNPGDSSNKLSFAEQERSRKSEKSNSAGPDL